MIFGIMLTILGIMLISFSFTLQQGVGILCFVLGILALAKEFNDVIYFRARPKKKKLW